MRGKQLPASATLMAGLRVYTTILLAATLVVAIAHPAWAETPAVGSGQAAPSLASPAPQTQSPAPPPQRPPAPAGTAPAVPGTSGAPAGDADLFTGAAQDSFGESIQVTVVSIDVVVRDKSGKPVTGLTRDDFALRVDGKPVEITNFYSLAGAGAARQPARAAAPENAGPAPFPEPKPEHLNLVVYVDNANLHPFDRNRVLKQLRAFLQKTLGPDDRVLLVTHDLGLHVRHSFEEAASTLGPALDKLEKDSGLGINKDLALRQVMETIKDFGCGRVDECQSMARSYSDAVMAEVKVTYSNLHHLLESLGGLDGRKVLLYVGDGVSTQVGTDVFGLIDEMCPSTSGQLARIPLNATAPLHQVVATANANLVTLYTLETAGLRSYASAEHTHPLVSFQLSRTIDIERQDSLTSLARDTGGRAALNGNDFSIDLEGIAADLNAGYSLGFVPARAGEGRTHDIKVEVKRPGLAVSYRQSYRDRSPQERLEGQVEAALLHGYADNPLGASLKLGAAVASEHGRVQLPVQVRVPFGKLAFLPQEDGRHGRVSIIVGNLDARGGMSPLRRIQLPLHVPDADAKRVLASSLGYDVKLLLEPGRQRLAFALRDDVANITSSLIQEVDVDKKGTATPVLPAAVHAPGAPSSR